MDLDVCAGILAGGKSSRMGANKALLPYGDSNFLEALIHACHPFPELLVSVDRPEPYRHLGVPLVTDELVAFGPVEGVYQLLRAARCPRVLVMAADMPLLRPEQLLALAGLPQEGEACLILRMAGKLEPLCSIYSKTALPALTAMRQEGCHKLRLLFDRVETRYLDGEALGFGPEDLRNINTPEEYQALTGSIPTATEP